MVAGKTARVVARPEDQVVGLRDDRQFFVLLHGSSPAGLVDRQNGRPANFKFDSPSAGKW